jgi:hypothetical protein
MGFIEKTSAQEFVEEQFQGLVGLLSVAADVTQDASSLQKLLSTGLVTAAADPTLADILAALTAAAEGPSAEVEKGKTPMPQNVTIMPPYDEASAGQNYLYLIDMSSIFAL